jgi:hypothetical protein
MLIDEWLDYIVPETEAVMFCVWPFTHQVLLNRPLC